MKRQGCFATLCMTAFSNTLQLPARKFPTFAGWNPILPLRFNSVRYPTPYTSRTHFDEYERRLRQRRKEEVARALEEVRIRTERETFLRQSEERGLNINGTFRDFLESAQAYILRSINSDECEEHPEEPKNKRFKAQE